jgi:hypothetical protein
MVIRILHLNRRAQDQGAAGPGQGIRIGWWRLDAKNGHLYAAGTRFHVHLQPVVGLLRACFGYCESGTGIDQPSAGVWDIGAGLEFNLPRTNAKFYAEARYFSGLTNQTHTNLIPVTFGVRW